MPRDSGGTYTRASTSFSGSTLWQQAKNAGQTIQASEHDSEQNDVATALTDSLSRSAKGGMLADLPMGGFRVTTMNDAASLDHATTLKQVNFARTYGGTSTGAANVYTCTLSAPPVAYVDGALFTFIAHQANTGSATFGISGLAQLTLKKGDGSLNLASGDIASGDLLTLQYYNADTTFRVVSTSRIALGLGTMSTVNSPAPIANGGTGATTASGARSNLQAAVSGANSDLTALSAILQAQAPAGQGLLLGANATNFLTLDTSGSLFYGFGATKDFEIKQFGDDTSVFSLRGGVTGGQVRLYGASNGTFPHQIRLDTNNANVVVSTGTGKLELSSPLAVVDGGTGATTAANARTNLGLGNLATINSPLPVLNGGTGSVNATGARLNLNAAAAGANSDITGLSACTTIGGVTSVSRTGGNLAVQTSVSGTLNLLSASDMNVTANGGLLVISASSDVVINGPLDLNSLTTATTATGGAGTLPSNPVGFAQIKINGTTRKIPYYAT